MHFLFISPLFSITIQFVDCIRPINASPTRPQFLLQPDGVRTHTIRRDFFISTRWRSPHRFCPVRPVSQPAQMSSVRKESRRAQHRRGGMRKDATTKSWESDLVRVSPILPIRNSICCPSTRSLAFGVDDMGRCTQCQR